MYRLSSLSLFYSSLLCFSSLHIVGSLTSKLPLIIYVCVNSIRCLQIYAQTSLLGLELVSRFHSLVFHSHPQQYPHASGGCYWKCQVNVVKVTGRMEDFVPLLRPTPGNKCLPFGGETIHHRKPTCPQNRAYFNRKYIIQPLIFRGHSLVFRGVTRKNCNAAWYESLEFWSNKSSFSFNALTSKLFELYLSGGGHKIIRTLIYITWVCLRIPGLPWSKVLILMRNPMVSWDQPEFTYPNTDMI